MPIAILSRSIKILTVFALVIITNCICCLSAQEQMESNSETEKSNQLRVAYFSQDPPSIVSISPSFDPDSYAVIAQIFDTLVYMDLDGEFRPGLATSWKQLSDTQWQFTLRKGVKFHNGEPFDSSAVKFTFDYILNSKNNAGNRWIFSTLKSVKTVKNDPFTVIFNTHKPDGMFLNRFNMFGSICPPNYIKKYGVSHFEKNPVGTGPFTFQQWKKGEAITLKKNTEYWDSALPKLETVSFVVQPKNNWVDAFANNEIDLIPNLSGGKTQELMKKANGKAHFLKRPVLVSYWVLIKNEGALSDLNVRKALNYAVNKKDIIHFADFGNALPMASIGKRGEVGANPLLIPFAYDIEESKRLLKEARVDLPLKLKALVADVSERPARIIQRNLNQVGIELELEFVSRSEWTNRVVVHKIMTGKRPDYDLLINMVDNPIYNLAFHAGLFLESSSPWSLLKSDEFDKKFAHALEVTDPKIHQQRLRDLDHYIQEQALMLFTTQKIITAAVSDQFDIQKFGLNGHLGYEILSKAKVKNSK